MKNVIFSIAAFVLPFFSSAQYTVGFENVQFPLGQNYWNGSDESGSFTIGGATFNNSIPHGCLGLVLPFRLKLT
jgi:hypothetical protein